jgi:hypothetical protein
MIMTLFLGILILISSAQSEQEDTKYRYIGTEKCASVCHNKEDMGFQYDIMKNGPHAQAYNVLPTEKARHYAKDAGIKEYPQESSICLECHITGAGLDTSFFASTYKKEEGVTCEACHKGPYISKAFIPIESDCLKCHNNSIHQMSKFDFNERRAKIIHPRPKVKLDNTQPVI